MYLSCCLLQMFYCAWACIRRLFSSFLELFRYPILFEAVDAALTALSPRMPPSAIMLSTPDALLCLSLYKSDLVYQEVTLYQLLFVVYLTILCQPGLGHCRVCRSSSTIWLQFVLVLWLLGHVNLSPLLCMARNCLLLVWYFYRPILLDLLQCATRQ